MDELAARRTPSLVVGVGASAGGLEAYKELLSVLPDRTGMAYILVQHLDPRHKSLLAELLAPRTGMRVVEAQHEAVIEADTVYVITPNTELSVRGGRIELDMSVVRRGARLSVDHLFRSLAREYGPRSVGLVLSGAGSDGAAGLREIKEVGGLRIAQEPSTASQPGMPQSAIAAGLVELVLEISEIPAALQRFEQLPAIAHTFLPSSEKSSPDADEVTSLPEPALDQIVNILRKSQGFDASVYRVATLERRILRRMMLSGYEDIDRYIEALGQEPEHQRAMVRDLLISVTKFFRDQGAFEAIRSMIVRPLIESLSPDITLRVWVPGCATGEEAYSLAMEFLDEIDRQERRISLQIFATDVDREALSVARAGIYSRLIADSVPPHRLDKYFLGLEGRGYQVQPRLRGMVSFAEHDICVDPPFSRVHLVSLRNVLIYLRTEAQRRVLEMMHFALLPEGYLVLGTSESASQHGELFTTVSKQWRLYQKIGRYRPLSVSPNRRTLFRPPKEVMPTNATTRSRGDELARRVLMSECVPPSLVVTEEGSVIFMHGELRPYLRFPEGSPSLQLSSILDPELLTRTQATVYRCRREKQTVTGLARGDVPGGPGTKVTVRPASELGDGTLIINFEVLTESETTEVVPRVQRSGESSNEEIIAQLDRELQSTREDLRNTVEELESSNEELRSSNEESMSINEELQSTNEELEATSEELRSLNEELRTVNAQLREKLVLLESAHDDQSNFFASAKIATVFLDEELRIKRFTPAAEELLRIDHDAEGCFVGDFARELLQEGLVEQARSVLRSLEVGQAELRTADGRWISRSVLPYRTQQRRIEGVVVTLVDVTALRSTTETLAIREQQQAVIARLGLLALEEASLQTFLDQAVREVQQTLRTTMCKILELEPSQQALLLRAGVGWGPEGLGQVLVDAGMDSQAGFTLHASGPVVVDDLATERRFSGPQLLRDHAVVSGLSCVIRGSDGHYGVLGAHTTEARVFTHEDVNFVQGVATVVAAAVGRSQARLRQSLETACLETLTNTAELSDAVRLIFDAFARTVGVSVGELWLPTAGGMMRRTLLSTFAPHRRETVEEALVDELLGAGQGVVGRVYERRAAQWVSMLDPGTMFVQLEAALALGLSGALVFPIMVADEAIAVVAVYTTRRLYAGPSLLRALESIGRSIGESVRRAAAEDELRRLAAIAEAAEDAIMSLDFDGTVGTWLQGAERLYGYTAAEMRGTSIEQIVATDQQAVLRRMIRRVRSGAQVDPTELKAQRKDGSMVHVSTRLSPIRAGNGQIIGISKFDRDITDERRAAEALSASERRFRGTFDNAAVGIAHVEPGSRLSFRRINDRLLQILGYSREEMATRTLEDVSHPDERTRDRDMFRELFGGEIPDFRLEKRYVHRNGSPVWVNLTASLARTADGQPDYAIVVVQDISARKRTEQRLQESEWRFRQILVSSPVPMLVCDSDGEIVVISDSWQEMFGYTAEELPTFARWAERVYGERASDMLDYMDRLWAGGEATPAVPDIDARCRDGSFRTLLLSGASLGRPAEGRSLRICAAADVTPQKQAERELLEASRQKDEFLAMLGHELRNPLAAVHGAARLPSLRGARDPELREAHAILTRQTSHMSKLLDGLLDVSRIIRGKITLDEQFVDLRAVVVEVVRDNVPKVRDRGLALEQQLDGDPLWIEGDPVRLTQVVDNLLSNAIKYTDEGSIFVSLARQGERAVLTVRDTGVGIEPELMPHIFDSFRQAQQSLHRARGGLGLGLALVRSLVQLHGGQVRASSGGVGRGAELVIELPLSPTAPPPETPAVSVRPGGVRVLIVEDEADLARVIRRLLEANGHEVQIATRGDEGIALAQQWRPDIVLCDLGLPDGVTGYDVARAIRADPETRDMALAAVTGYGRPEDKVRARDAGFDAHLTKPVDLDDLEVVIERLQRKVHPEPEPEPEPEPQ